MSSSLSRPWIVAAATIAAAVPVAFGCLRAISTGDDVRYLWMAGAAILGSMAVLPHSGARAPANGWIGRGLAAVASGAACAAVAAVVQGARSVPGVAIVAVAFGLCTGTSARLVMLARESRRQGDA
jgi:hypothetical protein